MNKLVIQANASCCRSDNVINISQTNRNSNNVSAGNVNSDSVNEIAHEHSVTFENQQQTRTMSDNMRLTSTPIIPKPRSQISETQQSKQSQPEQLQSEATAEKILLMVDSVIPGINR